VQQTFMNPTPGVKETFIAIAPISICEVVSSSSSPASCAPSEAPLRAGRVRHWLDPYFVERMDQTFNKHASGPSR